MRPINCRIIIIIITIHNIPAVNEPNFHS